MKQIYDDQHGVPILSALDIEERAEELISRFDKSALLISQRVPIPEIVKRMRNDKKYGLLLECGIDLGKTRSGHKILGKTHLKPLAIFIDSSLLNDPRFRFPFTLGHELGHVVFHRHVRLEKSLYPEKGFADTEYDLTGKKILQTPRDWIEWQANRFASAILMPASTIRTKVEEIQRESNINRNRGHIFLDDQPVNRLAYDKLKDQLQVIYGVNGTNVEYRLKDLGILEDHRSENVKHISQVLEASWVARTTVRPGSDIPRP